MNPTKSHQHEKSGVWNAVNDYDRRNRTCFVCEQPIYGSTAFGILDLPMHQSCKITTQITSEYCRRPAWMASGHYEVINEVSEVIMMARLAQRGELVRATRQWEALEYDDLVEHGCGDLDEMVVCVDFEWAPEDLVRMYLDANAGVYQKSNLCLVCQTPIENRPAEIAVFHRHESCQLTMQMAYRELYGDEPMPTGYQGAERQATAVNVARLIQQGRVLQMQEWTAAPQVETLAQAV